MTHYGLNPASCTWTSRLPIFSDARRRARAFESATGGLEQLRVYGDMGGTMPSVSAPGPAILFANGRNAATLIGTHAELLRTPMTASNRPFDEPSIAALAQFKPAVLRTLDWSRANFRTDWSKPRVAAADLLQGTDAGMAVELQALAAKRLNAALWWNAPPRYDLPEVEYEARIEAMLSAIVLADVTGQPPILEYGNELWNAGFPVHGWLDQSAHAAGLTWHEMAAHEIATLKRVADRVFGPHGALGRQSWYLFVGGQLTAPSHLDRLLDALRDLNVVPDLAGPAWYVTPLKASIEEWGRTGAVPTPDELAASCRQRAVEVVDLVRRHDERRRNYGVPFLACYEAGQSLIAGGKPWRKAAIEAQKTEWMGDLYRGIRKAAEGVGVNLLNWYSAAADQTPSDPRVDVFGLLEGLDLPLLPKALAAMGR